jgi:hypothetical protein
MRAFNFVINIHLSIKRQWISSKELGLERTSLPLICMHAIKATLALEPLNKGLNWQGGIMLHCVGEACYTKGRKIIQPNHILVRSSMSCWLVLWNLCLSKFVSRCFCFLALAYGGRWHYVCDLYFVCCFVCIGIPSCILAPSESSWHIPT